MKSSKRACCCRTFAAVLPTLTFERGDADVG
jgi:hypothetical protein